MMQSKIKNPNNPNRDDYEYSIILNIKNFKYNTKMHGVVKLQGFVNSDKKLTVFHTLILAN